MASRFKRKIKKKHSKIAIVIGTKAELIKTMPIMIELEKQRKDYWFIHTGQHPVKKACKEFGVKEPDFILSKEPEISTKFWSKISSNAFFWFIGSIFRIKKTLNSLKPKYVIYHGDTMSTAAAAIASSKLINIDKTWKNVHLEAGLRSGSLFEPFPEEISRKISDSFSDILLAVSDLSENNLKKERKKGRVFKTGNTVIDSSIWAYEKAKKSNKWKKLPKDFALINIHRHENLNNEKRMNKIIRILENIKIKAIWPMHDNTEYFLKKYGLMEKVKDMKNVEIVPLTSYPEFIYMISKCKYLVTDGGSIQEESLIFKKPCLILRMKTERQEGFSTGINFLTMLNVSYSKNIIKKIERNEIKLKKFKNPYKRENTSKNIVKLLE